MSNRTPPALLSRLDSEPAAAEQVVDVRSEAAGVDDVARFLHAINVAEAVAQGYRLSGQAILEACGVEHFGVLGKR